MTKIVCPHCGKSFEMSEAFKHEIESELKTKFKEESRAEVEKVRLELEDQKRKNEEFKEVEIKLREEVREEKKKLEEDKKDLELTIQRRIDEERRATEEKIREESEKDHHLKDLEKDKKISDMERLIEELKKKSKQGSQQTQGEVLELEIEDILRQKFPNDEIADVPKGIRGADIVQVVKDRMGKKCGIILWESKNAKWSEGWIAKLKDDQRTAKADIAVLVSENTPEEIKSFTYRNGVWVTSRQTFAALAEVLRVSLYQVHVAKQSTVGKDERMENLFQYLSGPEFKHRIEGTVDTYVDMLNDLDKEKRWFTAKWAKQEKSIRRVIDHTVGMHGELKSMMGEALLPIKNLELESGEE